MARQNFNVNSNEKKIEIFDSYGGGMVTQAHPEKLRNHESILMENVDLLAGGVVKNRGAYYRTNSSLEAGMSQGKWKYRMSNGGVKDIVAIGGYLYSVVGDTYTKITINGLVQFQTARTIEAVQLRDKMYFATGSGLVEYDGTTATKVVPYVPNGLEALYIGTNGLAANPDNYLTDATGAGNVLLGVTTSMRYGVINTDITFTAYVQKVASDTLEYKFEYKLVDSLNYTLGQNYGISKTWTKKFDQKAEYSIRVTIRKQGTTIDLSQYVIPRYKVNSTPEVNPEPNINGTYLDSCNKLFIHYDRLWIYGDTGNTDFLYISHLNKFNYFPRSNTIKCTDPLRGALNKAIQFKDFLVCFTDGSIQLITGTNPQNFQKTPLHTELGSKWGDSVQVMKNSLAFVGTDNGVYVLKSFNYASNDKLNVERIDDAIRDEIVGQIKVTSKVLSCIYDNQYYLYVQSGSISYIWRYYHDVGVWVRDSLGFTLNGLYNHSNVLCGLHPQWGRIFQLKYDVFYDDVYNPYRIIIRSKNFNFGEPHHRKRMKQFQLLTKIGNATTINVKLYADNNLLIDKNLSQDNLQNSEAEKLIVTVSGRFRTTKTELTVTVTEDIQLTGFGFIFKENTPK